jgi:hypothetical protein
MPGEALHEVHEPTFPRQPDAEVNEGARGIFTGGYAPAMPGAKPATPAGQTLRRVADIVDGPRNRTHGHKEQSFTGIAKAWTRLFPEHSFSASDVALAMVALKEQRARYGEQSPEALREHVEDLIGYWAIYLELKAAGC